MSIYVQDCAEQRQAERQLLIVDLVEHLTQAGHEARQVRLGVYPGVALWCSGGASTVILVDDDIVQWGQRWQHLVRWRESTAEQIVDQVVSSSGPARSGTRPPAPLPGSHHPLERKELAT